MTKRIVDTSPKAPLVDVAMVAEALGWIGSSFGL
jgi:hypothetical protein